MKIVKGLIRRLASNKEIELNDGLEEETARVYLNNLKIVKSLEKDFDFKSFFYWQPTLFTKDILSNDENRITNEGDIFFQPPKEFYIQTYKEIKSNDLKDLSDIFDEYNNTIFLDWAHITEDGNKIIAEEIGKDVEVYLE